MDADRLRFLLLKLPHVVETIQWGGHLVFWAGDKALGGKMFAVASLEPEAKSVIRYAAGPERYAELLELEGFFPAPYLARAKWIAVEHWNAFPTKQWEQELCAAYDRTLAKLPPKTQKTLQLPIKEQKRLIAERRKLAKSSVTEPRATPSPGLHRRARGTKADTRRSKPAPAK